MRRRTKVLLGGLTTLVVLVGIALMGGCSSSTLPPTVTAAQLAAIKEAHIAATVGVEPYQYSVYSEALINDLRASDIFDEVDTVDSFQNPKLIAAVERTVYGTATIPIVTIITLGLVPTSVDEEYGHVFSLRSSTDPRRTIEIEYTYRGKTTLGWWALFLNFSSDRQSGDPTQTARFRENFAAAIHARRDAILRLTDQE